MIIVFDKTTWQRQLKITQEKDDHPLTLTKAITKTIFSLEMLTLMHPGYFYSDLQEQNKQGSDPYTMNALAKLLTKFVNSANKSILNFYAENL